MPEQRTLWDTKAFRFTRDEALIVPAFRDWLAHSESELGRYLAGIQYASEFSDFSKDEVHQLEAMIVKASGKKATALLPLRLLGKVVYRVNHTLQLSIPQPTLAVHLAPPNNPFAFTDVVLSHRSVDSWLKAEETWLRDLHRAPSKSRENNVPFELLLLSSALHCGILNADLAFALHAAMQDPINHLRYSGRTYLDLSLAWSGKPDQEIRRWYPDDAVACLIARLAPLRSDGADLGDRAYGDLRHSFSDRLYRKLRRELGKRILDVALLPKSLTDFFDRIALFLRSEMPATMVRYATRELQARSLLQPSIDLVYGDPAIQTITVSDSDEAKSEEELQPEAYGGEDPDDAEPVWLQQIREAFVFETTKKLLDNLGRIESHSGIGIRIISFARNLVRRGPSSGKPLKPNSVKCCVLTVGRRLGRLLEERDLCDIDSEILEDLYVRAIDDAGKDSEQPYRLQSNVAWALREFHCFLVRKRQAKPLNEVDVFRIPRGFPSVDAMIVSVDDVYKALRYLDYEPNPSWSEENRQAAKMEVLLGFFGGLRTMEGLGALQRHFPGGSLLPFLVLPTENRDLKTPNAARMIPLALNMAPFDDLIEFAAKWTSRHDESRIVGDRGLFESASEDVVIPMVGTALRAVTGNKRLRYYSLRHSFSSWLLTRLQLSDMPEIPNLFGHLPKTMEWLRKSKEFRRELYGNDQVSNNHAWAVATLMGHSNPNVSFASYTHLNDIVLPEFLRNCNGLELASSTRERLRLSSSRSRDTADCGLSGKQTSSSTCECRSLPAQKGVTNADHQIADNAHYGDAKETSNKISTSEKGRELERAYALQEVAARFPNLKSGQRSASPERTRSWLEQTWGLLYMSTKPNRDPGELAKFFGFEMAEAQRIIARNDDICWQRSSASERELHVTTCVESKAEGGVQTLRYPRRPGRKAIIVAEQFGVKIERMMDEAGDEQRRILDYWSSNLVPQWTSTIFQSQSSPDGNWCAAPETQDRVRNFLRFLHRLGLTREQLSFRGAGGTRGDFVPTSWYAQWGLISRPTCKIRNYFGRGATQIAEGQWLSIGPRSACRGDEKFCSSNRDGFRFAMLLASIRFGQGQAVDAEPTSS